MQNTSDLYKELLYSTHRKEVRLTIGDTGRLIGKDGSVILFGGTSILLDTTGADNGYGEDLLVSLDTTSTMFATSTPTVGSCISSEIDIVMLQPLGEIPRQARLVPYVRLTDGARFSEWLQKGVYFLDTREIDQSSSGIEYIHMHGFDAMLKTEQPYPSSQLQWPAKDIDVVKEIANLINVPVDSRTLELMSSEYLIQYPANYYCREVLGYIAALYAGCFVMSDLGELRLVSMYNIPPETRYLVSDNRQPILFGGDRILV